MFDPLEHPGIPIDHHGRHWRELDIEPVDARATDPFTCRRIGVMTAVEASAEQFDRQYADRLGNVEARRSLGVLADATAERRQRLAALRALAGGAAGASADRGRAASDLVGWAARNERTTPRPLSLLHDWMVRAADRWVEGDGPGSSAGGWEALVVHEWAGCYLYYAFLAEEEDRRLRPLWELHLQMRLACLREASTLIRRFNGGDAQEVMGRGLPEPVGLRPSRPLGGVHETDRTGLEPEKDVLEVLIAHHARMNRLCDRVAASTGEGSRMAFGELARLITAHETAEEQTIHPLLRRLRPDDNLAGRLRHEESRISDALSDAVRAAAHGHLDDRIDGLRDLVIAHFRREEREAFPRLRRNVPVRERTDMGRGVHAAEAAAGAGTRDATPTGPRDMTQTTERVRDALAGWS